MLRQQADQLGAVLERGTDCLVEVGGLGLAVTVPAGCAAALPPAGEKVRLWTHLAVREDAWTLYGFLDPDELALFRLLISVTGVGPAWPSIPPEAWLVGEVAITPGPIEQAPGFFVGPNGAGKTTIFNLITKVYQPTTGTILIDGKDTAGISGLSEYDGQIKSGKLRATPAATSDCCIARAV